ncbi:phosphoenolpyruvate hydrolase family protein [Rhizobium giardinii]|uniref:Putative TIM-barrel enzyme n=1 Tax=Rhizobium giardinii TaxID=56731 RepID=A0A7W8XCF8_9HYPH|nr:phosphoenolpyruvate hydrolase family protein [Rhizobium giardinii]MBB5538848.1 putative TIM-barrel enzyme [Rhizobium giardinii]
MRALPILPSIQIVTDLEVAGAQAQRVSLYCPSCKGLGASYDSVVLLPIHDANGRLLSELGPRRKYPEHLYAGVFALDPFRRHAEILRALECAGFTGVVNFPSVSMVDGEMRLSLDDLGYGAKTEISFLRAAVANGFSALALVDSSEIGREAVAAGVCGLIAVRHTTEAVLDELSKIARQTTLGLFRLPEAVGSAPEGG